MKRIFITEAASNMKPKGFMAVGFVLAAFVVLSASLLTYVILTNKHKASQSHTSIGTACTQEAKQCPDGSYVGRTGPHCEFAACPTTSVDTSTWKNYSNEELGLRFEYPIEWGEVKVKSSYVPLTRIEKEITFSKQPNVDFALSSVITPSHASLEYSARYLEDTWKLEPNFDSGGQYTDEMTYGIEGIKKLCTQTLEGHLPYQVKYGECDTSSFSYPYIVVGSKKIQGAKNPNFAWVNDGAPPPLGSLSFVDYVFIPLESSFYPILNLRVRSNTEISSENFCTNSGQPGQKDYGCMADVDKNIIKQAWLKEFSEGQFAQDLHQFIASLNVTTPSQSETYNTYLFAKTTFHSSHFPISFTYPAVFGSPKENQVKEGGYLIELPGFTVNITSRQDAILRADYENKVQSSAPDPCVDCYFPSVSYKDKWGAQNKAIMTKEVGQKCDDITNIDLGDCMVSSINGRKVLVGYSGGNIYSSGTKDFVFYLNGYNYTASLGFFEGKFDFKDDPGLEVLNNIVQSINFSLSK